MSELKNSSAIVAAVPDDDSDDYFDRIQAAADVRDLEHVTLHPEASDSKSLFFDQNDVAEDAYFASVLENNSQITEASFLSADAPIWHSMMRLVAKEDGIAEVSGASVEMMRIDPVQDASRWMLCEQWLFGFLSHSSKLYVQLTNMSSAGIPHGTVVCIDDYLHPSIAALFKLHNGQLEITLFSPFAHHEIDWRVFFRTLARLTREFQVTTVMYCGLDVQHYERVIRQQVQWQELWVEWCDMFVLHDGVGNYSEGTDNSCGDGQYFVSDLTDADAAQINDTWKYRSEGSYGTVLHMIASFPCVGVRHKLVPAGNETTLVSWCLTYSDGAIGMLYTLPGHRGQGLARMAVKHLLHKSISTSIDGSRGHRAQGHAPYCFIERSNDASKALFLSLGFEKSCEVVWTAQILKNEM